MERTTLSVQQQFFLVHQYTCAKCLIKDVTFILLLFVSQLMYFWADAAHITVFWEMLFNNIHPLLHVLLNAIIKD